MEISWLWHSCFQLRGKNVSLVTDPFIPQPEPSQGETPRQGKISAPIVTLSHNDLSNYQMLPIHGNPRTVRGPGEYEISDVLITGVASYRDHQHGKERGRNTIYIIHMDDVVICHLGDLGHTLQEEQLEEVADADVLLLPIGSNSVLSATQAAEIISQVEPRIVIPMSHQPASDDETGNPLDKFYREMGIETVNTQAKLVITKSSLPLETQVVLLTPR